MKDLSIEEKAKAYDEAIKRAKKIHNEHRAQCADIMVKVFPELKESEDERIRKEIISHLKYLGKYCEESIPNVNEWIAWLEKQGEQKPQRIVSAEAKEAILSTEWNISDFRTWQYIVSDVLTKKDGIGQYIDSGECKKIAKYMQEEWSKKLSIKQKPTEPLVLTDKQTAIDTLMQTVKVLKERGLYSGLQESLTALAVDLGKSNVVKPVEWSEEDDIMIHDIDHALRCQITYSKSRLSSMSSWIYELKNRVQPQNLTVTDEELAQAKKEAYNDALDKIEYHSGNPTFDDGWHAAIWYLKKRNTMSQNIWKPSDEQLAYLLTVKTLSPSPLLDSLYNDLKKL